ncbi:3'-N-debenzoyl-2'-deoxytaxol N-benzoyltransferase [Quillaja saponaria]|uniref:3'-N-debenzoyl-2'-deoxytaxol N-benzoyltransferase n=1 Tax=Quillaja saponaria TaxID=32244 RepID=A0AAD7Q1I9_QUISA|nr:3'-N-debenzoyl-2'-deoxytaxol N-benzoyltransferase [Quillaja saponaria]
MEFSVIRSKRSLVRPAEQTPSITLDLSIVDRLPAMTYNVETLHVFKHGPQAATVIRQALSKALVPYYPLAGRQKESSQGYLQVECTGDGVWFIEASTGCTLGSVNNFDNFDSIPYADLLPDQIPETESIDPLVKMQVTEFACGGFVIGLIFCHCICDGLGAAQFLNAIGELARGLENPSIAPVWHRDFFPPPPEHSNATAMKSLPPLPVANYKLKHENIDIPFDKIHKLKQEFHEVTGQSCSAFEIVAAGCWRSRIQAIEFKESTQVKLVFFANCRHLLDPPLPKGFYGNCFFPVKITASCESLTRASLFDVVKMIQEAKAKLPLEFFKYFNGDHLKDGSVEDPFASPPSFNTLFISEWARLGLNKVDYGWGPPVDIIPIHSFSSIPVAFVGSLPLPKEGVRLITWCVEEARSQTFLDYMTKLIA